MDGWPKHIGLVFHPTRDTHRLLYVLYGGLWVSLAALQPARSNGTLPPEQTSVEPTGQGI